MTIETKLFFTPRTDRVCNIISHIQSAHLMNVQAEDCRRDKRPALVHLSMSANHNAKISAASMFKLFVGEKK